MPRTLHVRHTPSSCSQLPAATTTATTATTDTIATAATISATATTATTAVISSSSSSGRPRPRLCDHDYYLYDDDCSAPASCLLPPAPAPAPATATATAAPASSTTATHCYCWHIAARWVDRESTPRHTKPAPRLAGYLRLAVTRRRTGPLGNRSTETWRLLHPQAPTSMSCPAIPFFYCLRCNCLSMLVHQLRRRNV